ncbi:MAG: RagB/SusD family nutrient uptake outer membrane protein [Bacteroidota bacterium]|nr:RagB/SusD family nutrient uptake outer membrane protein [Bacteroidota bacterium]
MKKHSKIFHIVITLMMIVVGCKPDMDINNPKAVGTETYYTTVDQLKAAIIPAYEAIIGKVQGTYARNFYFTLLARGDDMDHTFKWEPMYYDTYNTLASDGGITSGWKDLYNGVYAANLAIDRINNFKGTITDDQKNQLLAEARFLRAFHYMHLCEMFGETVPLLTTPAKGTSDYYPANAKVGEVYAQIISDFQFAATYLPVKSKTSDVGRATQGAAQGYLAKAYMYRPILELGKTAEFDKAAVELKKIIDSKEYSLMENYRANSLDKIGTTVWAKYVTIGKSDMSGAINCENNSESLFEVQMVNGPSWLGGDNSDSWRFQEVGMFDGTGGSWWNLAPNPKTFNEFEAGDPRKFMTLWCPGGASYYVQEKRASGTMVDSATNWQYWMDHLSSNKNLFGMRKYVRDWKVDDIDDDINDRLMRYADILLMYAECLHETGHDGADRNDATGAKYYIQMVRDRANKVVPSEQTGLWYQSSPGTLPNVDDLLASAPTINGITMNNIKNIIQHERYVELCGEYVRYFDLVRWGMADSKWLDLLVHLNSNGNVDYRWNKTKSMYYPFPQTELDNNKNLIGNSAN